MERSQLMTNCDLIYDQYPIFHSVRKFDETKKPWTKITIAKKTRMLYDYAKDVTDSIDEFNRLYYHLVLFLNEGKINKCANVKLYQGKIIDIYNIEAYTDDNGLTQYSINSNIKNELPSKNKINAPKNTKLLDSTNGIDSIDCIDGIDNIDYPQEFDIDSYSLNEFDDY